MLQFFFWNGARHSERFSIRLVLAVVFLVHSAHNLLFNIVLTGTHERYLYHCYPFLLMAFALLGRKVVGKAEILISVVGAIVYGEFVRSVLLGRVQSTAWCLSVQTGVFLVTVFVLVRVIHRGRVQVV